MNKTGKRMKKMLESGNSSLFSLEMGKNRDTDYVRQAIDSHGKAIKSTAAFFSKCKVGITPRFVENDRTDEKLKFFRLCEKEHVMCMPLFAKVRNQSLCIKNTVLNMGVCKAMRGVLQLTPNLLTKIYLDSCSLGDSELALILEGLKQQQNLKVLCIQNNSFDEKCTEHIISMLQRRMPYNLEELLLYHNSL